MQLLIYFKKFKITYCWCCNSHYSQFRGGIEQRFRLLSNYLSYLLMLSLSLLLDVRCCCATTDTS